MAYKIRRSNERKYFDHGWLKTYHTFSFGEYYDPNFMGFRNLRVINEDRVAPGHGFPPHHHENMEIISVVLEGELAHKDSMGTESIIHQNDVQAMSAGSGIHHSEYNPSPTQAVHFLQIWILPDTKGIAPRYQQIQVPSLMNQWVLLASKNGREGSLKIQQDVELFIISLAAEKQTDKSTPSHRYGWLQVIDGKLELDDDVIQAGDGASIDPSTKLNIKAIQPSKLLFFELN